MVTIAKNSDAARDNPSDPPPCQACHAARAAGARFCPQCGGCLVAPTAKTEAAAPDCTPLANPGPATASPISDVPKAGSSSVAAPPAPPVMAGSGRFETGSAATCACGRILPEDPRFCPGCGLPVGASTSSGYVLTALGDGSAAPLTRRDFIIGKDPACDLAIPDDEYVSRRHARLRHEDGLVFLEDLGSSNGTLLRLRRAIVLEAGDEIVIGTQVLRLEKRP